MNYRPNLTMALGLPHFYITTSGYDMTEPIRRYPDFPAVKPPPHGRGKTAFQES